MEKVKSVVYAETLTKVFQNGADVLALNNVSLKVAEGEFLAVTGPSGSGKTTLLNLIGTLDVPTEGRIVVNDIDTGTLKGNALADFRRENIGFVFQFFNLVPVLTALENVMLPLLPYQRRLDFDLEAQARDLLTAVSLESRMHHLPSQLSGGEQQRTAIARALVNTPKVVLADEPTGNVDSQAGKEIILLLRQLNLDRRVTVILVTHNEVISQEADRVVRLRDGSVVR
ncbi:MAG: ABC transporter ATP-binding protein [Chloroflexota bacterium]|nr:ABC transporter ATP-binding protein [Chloroflexota bacterium]